MKKMTGDEGNDEDSESSWLAWSFLYRYIHDHRSVHLEELSLKTATGFCKYILYC